MGMVAVLNSSIPIEKYLFCFKQPKWRFIVKVAVCNYFNFHVSLSVFLSVCLSWVSRAHDLMSDDENSYSVFFQAIICTPRKCPHSENFLVKSYNAVPWLNCQVLEEKTWFCKCNKIIFCSCLSGFHHCDLPLFSTAFFQPQMGHS